MAALTVIGVLVFLVARRDLRILNSMTALLTEGRHADVLAHQLPSPSNRRMGEAVQASSAVLTGRFALALELLGASGRRVRGFRDQNVVAMLRGAALIGLGRYREAAELIGDGPTEPALRRLRAQAAIETGEDDLAERLLSIPDTDPVDEAGQRRMLGDLRLRRGRSADGEALVRDAQRMYADLDDAGVDVDEAICWALLGRAELREGHPAEALRLLEAGLAGLARRPDNAPDLSYVHALLAEAQAGIGNAQASAHHLAAASDQAVRCGSQALDAEVARATGMVAARQDRSEDAREALRDALLGYEALGALPEAALVREELGRLDA